MTDAIQHHCTPAWYMRPPVWLLGVVLVALAVFGIMEMNKGPAAIPYGDFLNQLAANNIATVTFSGTQIDGKFKHPLGQAPANGAAAQTSFRSEVPVFGDPTLLPELRKEHIPIAVTSSSAYWWGTSAVLGGLAAILLAKPMLLIIAAAFIAGLVRVARGGKMEMRSTLAMLPMFRSFAAEGGKPKESPGNSSHPVDRRDCRGGRNDGRRSTSLQAGVVPAPGGVDSRHRRRRARRLRRRGNAARGRLRFPTAISSISSMPAMSPASPLRERRSTAISKQPVKETAANNAAPQTAFRSQVPAFGDPALLPELRQQHVAIDVVSSSSWLSWLGRLPWPMVLIIVALLIAGLVKLVRGDKAATGSALPSTR